MRSNQPKTTDKTTSALQSIVGVSGLVLVLIGGVFVPLKVAEVFFGYSVSDAFWNIGEVKETNRTSTY